MKRAFAAVHTALVLLASSAAAAPDEPAGKRAFELRDHYRVAFVGAPALSPDGSKAAVAVTTYDFDAGTDRSSLWLLDAAGGETPTLVVTGERDYRVPYTQSLQFFSALQKQGVPSRLVVFPDSGHWPGWRDMAFYYNAHLDWFHRWLGGEPAPFDVEEMRRNRAVEGWGKE